MKDDERLKPTCKEVHRLISENMDRPLTWVERMRMRLHLLICRVCTNFQKQMSTLRRALREFPYE